MEIYLEIRQQAGSGPGVARDPRPSEIWSSGNHIVAFLVVCFSNEIELEFSNKFQADVVVLSRTPPNSHDPAPLKSSLALLRVVLGSILRIWDSGLPVSSVGACKQEK